jgi:hypothetical protein
MKPLNYVVKPFMIEPMTRPEEAGYVPLSSALLWIVTDAGSTKKPLQGEAANVAWDAAVARLLPLISTGQIEIIGRPATGAPSQTIEGQTFAGIFVSYPLHDSLSTLTSENPWISCTPYIDQEYWGQDFNDQLVLRKATCAAWTHLQVKKSDVLREIVFPNEAKASTGKRGAKPTIKEPQVETITLKVVAGSHRSRALADSINEVFPEGVPVGTLLAHVKEKLEGSAHFKRVGLNLKFLKAGTYDTSLKRILLFAKS